MRDITMCSGEGCVIAEFCYRQSAEPHEEQSWFAEPPIESGANCCDYFIANEKVGQAVGGAT